MTAFADYLHQLYFWDRQFTRELVHTVFFKRFFITNKALKTDDHLAQDKVSD